MIRKNIKVLTLVLAFVMIFGTTTAFAAEGDIFTKANGTLRYSANQINVSVPARNDVRVNNSLYQIEVSGVKYDLAAASAAYAQDPANWKAILSGTQGLTVVDVSAINAKQVEIKFSKAVSKTSLFENGVSGALRTTAGVAPFPVLTMNSLDGNASGALTVKLSTDGKTLTVTSAAALSKRYDVLVNNIKSTDGKDLVKYQEVKTFVADTTAPTVASTTRISSNKFNIKFSEPVTGGTITAKYADGTVILPALTLALSADGTELPVDLSDVGVAVGKDIIITFNGVADMAGNLINPQPSTVTIVKNAADQIEPAITSVAQTGAKTFSIKFNKDLDGSLVAANVTVGGTAAIGTVKKISASEYEFTMAANLDGIKLVSVAAGTAKDLDGQTNTLALTKTVTFVVDEAKPVATSALVVINNQEYIQLTFDKNVTAGNVALVGSQVKDFITTPVASVTVAAAHNGTSKNVLNIPLTGTGLAVKGAAYDLTVSSTAVKSDAGFDMKDVNAKFTRGEDVVANTSVITSAAITQTTPDKIIVTFTIPALTKLDGAVATNTANYSIPGATIESIDLGAVTGSTQIVTINLVKGSNTFTGTRNIVVSNMKIDGSSKVFAPIVENTLSLAENVAPVITKAELTSDTTIVLTFSEVVKGTGGLEVFVGTTKLTDKGTLGTGKHTETDVSTTAANKITITLAAADAIDAEDLATGVKVKVVAGTVLNDVTGVIPVNKLLPATVNVTLAQ